MKVSLQRLDDAFHFQATNDTGNTIEMDASPDDGGQGAGVRPMQLMLMGLGGCSGIDVISILKKARQDVQDFAIELEAERAEGEVPSLFTHILVHYRLTGSLREEAVRRAIELSLEKYCSVAKLLEKTATITYAFTINGTRYEPQAQP